MVEVERIEQIIERRAVGRHVRIVLRRLRVGKIVTAAGRQRLELPVALDELQDRDVVAITVMDLSAGRIRRENQQRNARPIAEEVERLDEARVPVATGLIKGDEDGRLGFELGIVVEGTKDVQQIGLEQIDLRALRMTVEETIGLAERYRRQSVVLNGRDQVSGILDMRRPNRRICHDGSRVLEGLQIWQ